jgi:hypothetical protein
MALKEVSVHTIHIPKIQNLPQIKIKNEQNKQ